MPDLKIRRSRRLLAGVAGIALFGAACGSTATTESAETPATPGETPAAEAPTSTESAEGTTVQLALDGGQLDWNSLEGTDTVLWFWAPW